ncbi:MAG: right-handed parallel beta-helix repeat-containing protein [Prevotella sp.]|nr:right-handed parallel beta-helix repeat-containing protein [Prevotella sp.]
MKKAVISGVAAMTMLASPSFGGNIYVSTTGNDSADGTKERPFATLTRAIKQAREWRRLHNPNAEGGIYITMCGGTYTQEKPIFLRPEDSGTATSPTIIQAAEGEQVTISGGKMVTNWQKGTDDERVRPELRSKLWIADAPTMGNRIVETRQLWVNGKKALRASQFGKNVMERMTDFRIDDESIIIPISSLKKSGLKVDGTYPQLEMIVHQRWAIAILRVKAMQDMGDGNVRVTFHNPESQLEFAHPWPQPVIGGERGNSSFCLVNALEMLDEPGEWYQDYPSGKIYYYPREGEDMAKAEAIVPVVDKLMAVEGSNERRVSNITFSNIAFEHSAWLQPSYEGLVTLQGGFAMIDAYKLHEPGLPEKAELENQAWIKRPASAISIHHSDNINFRNCAFRHLSATALDYETACYNSIIDNCIVDEIGGNGIMIGAFPDRGFETHVPYIPQVTTDICHDITISNCQISDAANEDWGAVGIAAGYVRNVTIDHNHVYNLPYSGICVGWGWTALESGMRENKITNNEVHDFALMLYDAGGIYTLSNQPNSLISGNKIYNIGKSPYATNERAFEIYFDEATDGFTVKDNDCTGHFGYNKPGPKLVISD